LKAVMVVEMALNENGIRIYQLKNVLKLEVRRKVIYRLKGY